MSTRHAISILLCISSIVTALAGVALAFVAYYNHRLAQSLTIKSEQHEQEMRDLLHAMVLAQMLKPHGGESVQSAMQRFRNAYKGKTQLFD